MTDRDIISIELTRACLIHNCTAKERNVPEKVIDETPYSIIVKDGTATDGPRYIFDADGVLKSIIKDGRSYGNDGERKYKKPVRRKV